jgi:surface antigen
MSAAPGLGMMTKLIAIVFGASLIAGAGCATESGTGAAVGAGAGGIIGTAAGGAGWGIFGAAVGGLLGYGVGHQVEVENERRMAAALEANQPTTWAPEQGRVYTVQPQPIYYAQGRQCREFRLLAESDGRPRHVYGTACRAPDGRWEVVNTR